MKSSLKQISAVLLCIVLVASFCVAAVGAQKNGELTLSIEYRDRGNAISDVDFVLYFVARFDGEGNPVFTDDFKNYPVDISGADYEGLKSAAHTLKGFVRRDTPKPYDSAVTDDEGILTFPTGKKALKSGLYLVIGKQTEKDGCVYTCEPVLFTLPGYNEKDGSYSENVTINIKFSKNEAENDVTERSVIKFWKNDKGIDRPKKVVVDLLENDSVYDTVNLNSDNNWRYKWDELPVYDEAGSAIEWDVVERTVEDYAVSVSNSGKTVTIENKYSPNENPEDKTTARGVKKLWDDEGYENKRPTVVMVDLLRNGRVYDTARLSESTGWSYVWKELDRFDKNGEYITWSINERTVPGYIPKTELNGYTFVLTNSYKSHTIPRTGMPWWPVIMLTACGLFLLLIGILLKKRNQNEKV